MKSLNLYDIEDLRFEEIDKPVITSPTDVIIKVKATGICGSDTSRYKKLGPYQKGMTFGHEFSGIVENVGSQVTSLTVGDRVTGCPAIVCHQCAQCEQGNYSRCESLYVIGSLEPGCFAEFVKLPISNVLKLPDNVDFTTAAMVEPSAVVAHGFYKTNMKPGATVAIMGCGSIGLLAIQWARIFGASHVIAIDIDNHKLDIAQNLGANFCINSQTDDIATTLDTIPHHIDVAVESAGALATIGPVLTLPKKGGEVLLLGIPYADIQLSRKQFEKILRNELNVIGSWNGLSAPFPGKEWSSTLHYMSTGELKIEPIISDVLPLEQGPETFDALVNKKRAFDKVIFTP
ncbi:galactitol-1-phosphate 5-dehydrogenase [Staphylococcus gallinarum]|uniref:galactitol-1-phosphate 5-dehydrogenase n=1 Tax=Staphylococcus gallinarum TaxID=1293 RepID=UPI000D1CBC1E|nr:galactitol-1-phosphate 5-dehydrogenase [Staphylococcus gallinarum]MBU7218338.1 galactitol-1-phosphate 5-dehydrogenase [Staphylococcus gallinarum]PTE36811.1 galactitol-1-phosphate 5-dehydrogenase [Staphylococcus gallinarum]RIO82978.1 galactitol-1-phosphate 5-dehydrogenase [Staphylococcus gallinarum]